MNRYTARNGTTFLIDPQADDLVKVAGAEEEGLVMSLDLDDMREFIQYLEAGQDSKSPNDADCAAVGPD